VRAIVFLLFVILVFFIVRFTLNRIIQIREQNRQKEQLNQKKQASSNRTEDTQAIVRCAECGIHLPQSEAYYDGKDTFCSEGHMQVFHEKSQNSQHQKNEETDTKKTEQFKD